MSWGIKNMEWQKHPICCLGAHDEKFLVYLSPTCPEDRRILWECLFFLCFVGHIKKKRKTVPERRFKTIVLPLPPIQFRFKMLMKRWTNLHHNSPIYFECNIKFLGPCHESRLLVKTTQYPTTSGELRQLSFTVSRRFLVWGWGVSSDLLKLDAFYEISML